ncbi:MAG: hypothetical protein WC872_00390 [Candidatus Absconditabacterales bacterium]|jgi:hypothetical protein
MKSLSKIFTKLFSISENNFVDEINTKNLKNRVGIICDIDSYILQFKKKCNEITENSNLEHQIMLIEDEAISLIDEIKFTINKAMEINREEGRI